MAKKWIDYNIDNVIMDLCSLISIRSVRKNEKECMPFGKGVRDAVNKIIDIAEKLGFVVINYDGYAVEIRVGYGEKIIGVLGHVDVVDGGDGWSVDPFVPTIKGEKIFGRGTVDDKGPIVCAMYAAKYLEEKGMLPEDIQLRIIIGADEESSWECMKYYKKKVDKLPIVSIVVDGNFPLINCEKGLLDFNMLFKTNESKEEFDYNIIYLDGGTAKNVVPSRAECKIIVPDKGKRKLLIDRANSQKIDCTMDEDIIKLESIGISAHAMNPEKGINAISQLIGLIDDISEIGSCNLSDFAKKYACLLGVDYHGKKMGIACSDDISGALTLNVGTIYYSDRNVIVGIDMRIPASVSYESIISVMKLKIEGLGFEYDEVEFLAPIYIDDDSVAINTLMKVYREITGDNYSKAIAIGGATYARCLENAISFGPIFPNQDDRTHESDEFISVPDLKTIIEIYISGIKSLCSII